MYLRGSLSVDRNWQIDNLGTVESMHNKISKRSSLLTFWDLLRWQAKYIWINFKRFANVVIVFSFIFRDVKLRKLVVHPGQ